MVSTSFVGGHHRRRQRRHSQDAVPGRLRYTRCTCGSKFASRRARRSNDNGLAETKNGAVVRKTFGYEHIPQRHATRFNIFCVEYLNPLLNFHRPCLFSTDKPDPKKPGRIKRVYRAKDAMTPLDKLASLPEAAKFLRPGITLEHLH